MPPAGPVNKEQENNVQIPLQCHAALWTPFDGVQRRVSAESVLVRFSTEFSAVSQPSESLQRITVVTYPWYSMYL